MKSIEEALKFVIRKKKENDKIIFITNIGLDLSGKRFIEIVRKIYKFDIMVLFYSSNTDHFKWIKDFPNCLYADRPELLEEYVTNYNIIGLKNLKKKIEEKFENEKFENEKLKFKDFSPDFLSVPIDNSIFSQKYNPYIRHVKIFCKYQNKYLYMTKNGEVKAKNDFTQDCLWDVTFLNNTITFYSNNYYLKGEKENAIGYKYMFVWKYKEVKYKDDKNNEVQYYFINHEKKNKNNILSIEDSNIKINKKKFGKNEIFVLIDVFEDNKNIDNIIDSSFNSDISNKLGEDISSVDIDGSKTNNINLYLNIILDNL